MTSPKRRSRAVLHTNYLNLDTLPDVAFGARAYLQVVGKFERNELAARCAGKRCLFEMILGDARKTNRSGEVRQLIRIRFFLGSTGPDAPEPQEPEFSN